VVLSVLDRKWREHLYEMDYLREGITLRGYGQRDPLVEYQREGYDMFGSMMEGIKEESVGSLFNLQVEKQESPIVEDATGGLAAAALGGAVIEDAVSDGAVPGVPLAGDPPGGGARGGGRHSGGQAGSGAGQSRSGGGQTRSGGQPRAGGGESRTGGAQSRSGGGEARTAGQPRSSGGQPRSSAGQPRSGGQRGSHARQGGAHAKQGPRPDARTGTDGPAAPAGLSARGLDRPQRPDRLQYSAPSDDASGKAEQRTSSGNGIDYSKVGRNAPCPCGSGRKFKQCHGDPRNR
jgi:preprotein translocase subunit SecA